MALSPSVVHWPFWLLELVRLAIIFSLAAASWYLMEKPLMAWRRRVLEPVPVSTGQSHGGSVDRHSGDGEAGTENLRLGAP